MPLKASAILAQGLTWRLTFGPHIVCSADVQKEETARGLLLAVGEAVLYVGCEREGISLFQHHLICAQVAMQSTAHHGDMLDAAGRLRGKDPCMLARRNDQPIDFDAVAHHGWGEEVALDARLWLDQDLPLTLAHDLDRIPMLRSRLAKKCRD